MGAEWATQKYILVAKVGCKWESVGQTSNDLGRSQVGPNWAELPVTERPR